MIRAVAEIWRKKWAAMVLTDVLFKVIAFVLLVPLLSAVFRGFLALTGRRVLADFDVVQFMMHPIGMVATVVVVGGLVAIFALEQAALMTISIGAAHGRSVTVRYSLGLVRRRSWGVLALACRAVVRVMLCVLPFLAAAAGVYALLLSDRDINFYLATTPPRFWWTAAIIGAVLAAMLAAVFRRVVGWAVALQLLLFEDLPARRCLAESRARLQGKRLMIARWLVVWFLLTSLAAWLAGRGVVHIGRIAAPWVSDSLGILVVVLGGVLLFGAVVQIAVNLLSVTSLAVLQGLIYDTLARGQAFAVPGSDRDVGSPVRLTRGQITAGAIVAVIGALVVGIVAIESLPLEEHVEITAHRGSASRAPENTMASVLAAIEDGADWCEIDVQESRDGVILVVHDRDLNRVAGAALQIHEHTAADLQSHDVGSYFDPKFGAERIPTLGQVLLACKDRIRVNVEIKTYGFHRNIEQRVIDVVEQHGMAEQVVVMSLDANIVTRMKQLRPEWRTGLLAAVAFSDLTRAPADFFAVSTKLATRRLVRSAHAQGRQVFAWTVNDPVTMSAMISRGVDNLITDYPAQAREVLTRRAAMSPTERLVMELAFTCGIEPGENSQ